MPCTVSFVLGLFDLFPLRSFLINASSMPRGEPSRITERFCFIAGYSNASFGTDLRAASLRYTHTLKTGAYLRWDGKLTRYISRSSTPAEPAMTTWRLVVILDRRQEISKLSILLAKNAYRVLLQRGKSRPSENTSCCSYFDEIMLIRHFQPAMQNPSLEIPSLLRMSNPPTPQNHFGHRN